MARAAWTSALLAVMCLTSLERHHAAAGQPSTTASGAWAIVDWQTGAVVAAEQPARLRQPVEPGSFLKVATLAAAFATGLASSDTRVPCAGEATVKGELIRCSHPRLRHPVRPAEALAVSCNVWFATIGARLPRARLDGVLAALGLPPTPARAPMPLVATGLRAAPSPPLAWVTALSRLLRQPSAVPLSLEARATLVEGLRGAALYGTASAFSERGLDVLAKTGTATQRAGGTLGVVVAAWPPSAPTRAMVLLAAGVAGKDAADLAAGIVATPRRRARSRARHLRRASEAPRSLGAKRRALRRAQRGAEPRPPRRAAPSPKRFASAPHARVGALASRRSPSRTTWLACWRAKPPPEVRPRRLKRLPWPCGPSPSATAGDTSETALTCARSRTARC